jgi:hypothetical protein
MNHEFDSLGHGYDDCRAHVTDLTEPASLCVRLPKI